MQWRLKNLNQTRNWIFGLIITSSGGGCVEQPTEASFVITEVIPSPLQLESRAVVSGRGFGDTSGSVTLGDRPLVVTSWSPSSVEVQIPMDVRGGERLLVLSRGGQHTPAFSVLVDAPLGERSRARVDQGVRPDYRIGADQSVDLSLPPVDQLVGEQVEVLLDQPNAVVTMEAEVQIDNGERTLYVHFVAHDPSTRGAATGWAERPLWGAAAQVDYPSDRLNFVGIALENGPERAALRGDIEGRIYWYNGRLRIPSHVAKWTLMTLKFRWVDPLDHAPISVSLPPRFVTLRGTQNQRLEGNWSAGMIQFLSAGGTP